jgi:hypothetical protein
MLPSSSGVPLLSKKKPENLAQKGRILGNNWAETASPIEQPSALLDGAPILSFLFLEV